MQFKFDDGGRSVAGFKGKTGDCVVRAIAIAAKKPYKEVYDALEWRNRCYAVEKRGRVAKKLKARGASPRNGNFKEVYTDYIESLGFKWTPTMLIGSGCKVHLKDGELPMGRLIVNVSKHLLACIDGVIHDIYDDQRGGTRCVYGYWSKIV